MRHNCIRSVCDMSEEHIFPEINRQGRNGAVRTGYKPTTAARMATTVKKNAKAAGEGAQLTMHSFRSQEGRINSADSNFCNFHSMSPSMGMHEGRIETGNKKTTIAKDNRAFCGTAYRETHVRLGIGKGNKAHLSLQQSACT